MPTFGGSGAPGQVTVNLDSVFGLSIAAYRKEMIDNIGNSNPLVKEILDGDMYESQEGGSYIQQPVMYSLTPADSYAGYDELSTVPTDGITDVIFDWSQCAAPIAYSMKEIKINKQKIKSLIKARIMQAEMGLQEYFSQALNWGSAADGGSGTLITPRVSGANGSFSIEPLYKLVQFDPTVSNTIGGINQNTYSWWRNRTKTSLATTYDAFLLEVDNIFNTCTLGTGGRPNLAILDQITYELFCHALYQKFRYTSIPTDEAFPFENIVYKKCRFVMEDKTPDVFTGVANATTYGTMLFLNTKFIKMIYESDSDFGMLKDDQGKTFAKPINGDSRVGHMAWMGNMIINNRRKQGVMGKIARTLTTP